MNKNWMALLALVVLVGVTAWWLVDCMPPSIENLQRDQDDSPLALVHTDSDGAYETPCLEARVELDLYCYDKAFQHQIASMQLVLENGEERIVNINGPDTDVIGFYRYDNLLPGEYELVISFWTRDDHEVIGNRKARIRPNKKQVYNFEFGCCLSGIAYDADTLEPLIRRGAMELILIAESGYLGIYLENSLLP